MTTVSPHRSPVAQVRRAIVTLIIVAFSLAAIGGIVVLLGAKLGETAGRVIGTTALVGAFSVALLCCAALLGRPLQPVGMVGVVAAVAGAGLSIWMLWYDGPYGVVSDTLERATGTAVTAASAFALACLLLPLADRRRAPVRIGLWLTLALFAIVGGMIVYLIWASATVDDEVYPRVLGVAAILAALGAVVVPVLSLLLPDAHGTAGLSRAAISRIEAEAARRGMPPDDLVATLLPPGP